MLVIDLFQVDAFSSQIFKGNPAAVCHLSEWLPDDVLLEMAREHNQSETAFFLCQDDVFELRWFTTLAEIDLCGHATLATAHVIFNHLGYTKEQIIFKTRFVDDLAVHRQADDWLTLDFPAWAPEPLPITPEIVRRGLGNNDIQEAYIKRDYLFVYDREEDVRNITPNFTVLRELGKCLCITAPGKDCDFVSRFFCPGEAHEEDPVTGSAHSMLIPYWAKRLGKSGMLARQLSQRGGELRCEYRGKRVHIAGQAHTYMHGKVRLVEPIR